MKNSRRDLIIYIIIGIALILAAGIYYWASKAGKFSPQAAENEVILSLSTGSKTNYRVGETFSLEVYLAVGQAEAKEIKLHYLNYDPQILQVQSVTVIDLDGFTKSLQTAANGKIEIAESTTFNPFSGSAKIAIINFKAISSGTANFTFDVNPDDTVQTAIISALDGKNILQFANTSRIIITD